MKRIKRLQVLGLGALLLSGCGIQKPETVDLTKEEALIQENYTENAGLAGEMNIRNVQLPVEENGYVSTFCIYENTAYYSVDFIDFYDNPTGEKETNDFDTAHNTKICKYNFETENMEIVYRYSENKPVQITDINCDGEKLIWEDYLSDDGWEIKAASLQNDDMADNVITSSMKQSNLNSITPKLAQESIFWYDMKEDADNPVALYRYDFSEKQIEEIQNNLMLASPFESLCTVNDTYTTYEYTTEGDSIIHLSDNKWKSIADIRAPGKIKNPVSNGKISIWQNAESVENNYLYYYDAEQKCSGKIEASNIFSSAIVGDMIIINQEGGLYFYDIKEKQYQIVLEAGYLSVSYIWQGNDKSVYAWLWEDANPFEIIYINNAEEYSEEDFLDLTESIQFQENSIY